MGNVEGQAIESTSCSMPVFAMSGSALYTTVITAVDRSRGYVRVRVVITPRGYFYAVRHNMGIYCRGMTHDRPAVYIFLIAGKYLDPLTW